MRQALPDHLPRESVVHDPGCVSPDCDGVLRALGEDVTGPGLLAHVLVSQYADHLPLYRQLRIYARDGVELDVSTLADWVGQASALVRPLVEAIGAHAMAGFKLHADDTPVPVLDPGRRRTKTGRLWTYVRGLIGSPFNSPPV